MTSVQTKLKNLDFPLTGQRQQDIAALTSIRIFMAVAVVVYHLAEIAPTVSLGCLEQFARASVVSSFFCLSGFILTLRYQSFDKSGSVKKFYIARLARIMPIYFFTLALGTATLLLNAGNFSGNETFYLQLIFTHVLLIQSWIADQPHVMAINPPAYSLSIEMLFYTLFPFLLGSFGRKCGFWLIFTLSISSLTFFCAPANAWYCKTIWPPGRLFDFLIGMTAAMFFLRYQLPLKKLHKMHFWQRCILELIPVLLLAWGGLYNYQLSAALFAVLLFVLAAEAKGIVSNFLSLPALVELGKASFALFLLHMVIAKQLLIVYDFRKSWGTLEVITCIVVMTGLAIFLQRKFEEPWRSKIAGWSNSKGEVGKVAGSAGSSLRQTGNLLCTTVLSFALCVCALNYQLVFPTLYAAALKLPNQIHEACTTPCSTDITFGRSGILQKAYLLEGLNDITVSTYWKTGSQRRPAESLAVHIVGRRGKMLYQDDRRISDIELNKGLWTVRVKIPRAQLTNAAWVGLALYDENLITVPVNSKSCDWNGSRLLLPLRPH